MIRKLLLYCFICVSFLATSCSDYQLAMKSGDHEFKYKVAKQYYYKGDYTRSNTLLQELVRVYKGTSKAAEAYYLYAQSFYGQKDYFMAGHYFRTLLDQYPRCSFAEDTQFMVGKCYYMDSPTVRLDQENTNKGIEAFKLYISLYPDNKKVEDAKRLIKELQEKLVYKSYLNGKLYYDMEQYKAAVISLSNSLKEYPDTKYRENLMFMLFRAKYLLAKNSVKVKQRERLNVALDEYYTYTDEWPDVPFHRDVVDRYFNDLKKMLNLTDEDLKVK